MIEAAKSRDLQTTIRVGKGGKRPKRYRQITYDEALRFKNEFDYLTKSIGERGEYLSGGQKQRLAFARSIYSKRKILVLDEITSSLDEVTEKELFNFIYGLKGEYTIILISHNIKMLQKCNKLYEIKDNKVTQIK